jgi:peptide/nickel transport system substrate-binding protein
MFFSKGKTWMSVFSLLLVLTLLLSACATPTPEVIEKVVEKVVTQIVKETQVVKETVKETVIVEGTPQVVEKEVTKVVEVEVEKVVTPTPEPVAEKCTEPAFGGVFKAALGSSPPSLDTMATVAAATTYISLHTHEKLVEFGEDYSVIPGLAESWDMSDDGKTYTFYLREGVKFHNGKEMTSEDVIASLERYLEVSARRAQFDLLESWEAPDDYTVVMQLSSPSAGWLGTLATPASDLSIWPKEIIEGKPKGEINPEDVVGTGPYQLVEVLPDQLYRMTRFEDYEPLPGERDGLGGAKIPYFDEVHLLIVPETGARMAGLETGEYDWVGTPPGTDLPRLDANPETQVFVTKPASGGYVLFNHADPLSGNLKFREAVLAVLDMEAVGMAMADGNRDLFDLNYSIWPPQTVWYTEDDYAQSRYNQNDPETAKQLLEEAGYAGEEVILVGTRTSPALFKQVMAVADQLQNKLDMNVRVEMYDWPGTISKWAEETGWHIGSTTNITLQLLNPNAASGYWGSWGTHPVRVHYSNPEFDAAFEALDRTATFEERKEQLKEIQRLFYEDLPNIKTVEIYSTSAGRSDICNYKGWYRLRFFGVWRQP